MTTASERMMRNWSERQALAARLGELEAINKAQADQLALAYERIDECRRQSLGYTHDE